MRNKKKCPSIRKKPRNAPECRLLRRVAAATVVVMNIIDVRSHENVTKGKL